MATTKGFSRVLAQKAKPLTLEFLREWIRGFATSDVSVTMASASFVGPWLNNLESICLPTSSGDVDGGSKVAQLLRLMIGETVTESEVRAFVKCGTDDF